MNRKLPVWAAIAFLLLGVLVWAPSLWRALPHHSEQPTTIKGMEETFRDAMKEAIAISQKPDASERMLQWVATKLKTPADPLRQEATDLKLTVPELYYAHRLQERANSPVPMDEVLNLYKMDNDWYNAGNRRGAFPYSFVNDLNEMIKAGIGA